MINLEENKIKNNELLHSYNMKIKWQPIILGKKFSLDIPFDKIYISFTPDPFEESKKYKEGLRNYRDNYCSLHRQLKKVMSNSRGFLQSVYDKKEQVMPNNLEDAQNNILLSIEPPKETKLEKYWNNKRPKTNILYNARGNGSVDPRIFCMPFGNVPTVSGSSLDDKATAALNLVHSILVYNGDEGEFWNFCFETMNHLEGDCEDGGILIGNIMENSGVPYWRIRYNVGPVKRGYHCYVTYLSPKDNEWYILDWCYWYTGKLNKKWKDAEKYFGIDFSWNKKYCFGKIKKD